jgi:hypothetical protein
MRAPGIRLHKLALFGWAVVVTAVLLLLSLPVLAGETEVVPALNLAVCRKLWNIFTQSTGNLLSLNFLEIFRGYTLEFICCIVFFIISFTYSLKQVINLSKSKLSYRNYTSNNKPYTQLAHYITGLIEGDGTIHVPKTERSVKGYYNYPSIQIVFHLKDLPLALLIQKEIGHGSISRKKGVNAYIYTVNNSKGLLLLIELMNGNMRTNKVFTFYKLIDWFNLKNKDLNFEKKELNTNSLISDAWLSGFIEADGHFSVRTSESGKYPKIECKFELSFLCESIYIESGKAIMKKIANFLEIPDYSFKQKKFSKKSQNFKLSIKTQNLKSNEILKDYLTLFPLYSSKYLDCQDFYIVLDIYKKYILNKELRRDFSSFDLNQIKLIKRRLYNRTSLNWDHLGNFFYSL